MQVEFKNVCFEIDNKSILHNVCFSVKRGETQVMLGASGSGKTTILKLLLGLIAPTSGEIIVDGEALTTMDAKALRRMRKRLAIVFQHGALFDSLTVSENVGYRLIEESMLSAEEIEQVVYQALCFVGMPDFANKMPWELSGGEKKRIAIARALASGAEMILFDEPTAGLDPINARNISSFIKMLKDESEITSIVVTHDLEHAFAVASQIALLHRGELIFTGTVQELKQAEDKRITSFISPSPADLVTCNIDAILGIARKRLESFK